MNRLYKFCHLPATEQWLLVEAALLLGATRIGLWLLPFRTLRRLLTKLTTTPTRLQAPDPSCAEKVAWAVEVAGRHMPGIGTCLTQALTAQVLLRREHHPSLIHIGVARGEKGRLEAHAWLESGGEIVIGGS